VVPLHDAARAVGAQARRRPERLDPMTARGGPPVKPHDILGNHEVRALVGRKTGRPKPLDRHTLIRWRDREGFPPPIRVLRGTPRTELWSRPVVLAWLRETGRLSKS
jgi:hypothetical protein